MTRSNACGNSDDAALLRQQAVELLTRLVADREASEQRMVISGRRDPLRTVTGVSAMERAIASTREMIADMDLMLAELDSGLQGAQAEQRSLAMPGESLLRGGAAAPFNAAAAARTRVGGMLSLKRPIAATA